MKLIVSLSGPDDQAQAAAEAALDWWKDHEFDSAGMIIILGRPFDGGSDDIMAWRVAGLRGAGRAFEDPLPRWPVYHVDWDKSHRCPAMMADWHEGSSHYVPYGEDGTRHFWKLYHCTGCGLRVARWPLLPAFPTEWHVFSGHVTWRQRARWAWIDHPKRYFEWHPAWLHRWLRRRGWK